jgi:lipid-A-disaccharide synthase-like uncharacterized protein
LKSNLPIKQKGKPLRKYHHERLANARRSLRLLKIFSSSPENPQVECELVLSDFNEKPRPAAEKYDVLSWYRGAAKPSAYISIRRGQKIYAMYLQPDLVRALHTLRNPRRDRYLWIDKICIDQENDLEKNYQIEMMADIYDRAEHVCVWLGEADSSSKTAMAFMKTEILQFKAFDDLCNTRKAGEKWSALCDFMQRPWFTKRWMIQEIALAQKVLLYCGDERIAWSEFAVAIEYLGEIEKATHRLYEVSDARDSQIPRLFEHVSALGASLLVDAAGKVLHDCNSDTAISKDPDSDTESNHSSDSEFEADGIGSDKEHENHATSESDSGSDNEAIENPDNPSTEAQVS